MWLIAGDALWRLARDERVPESFRLAHAFTFDRAICPFDQKDALAKACREVYEVLHEANPDAVNHWDAIADALEGFENDERSKGIALSATSVSDAWGEWDGEEQSGEVWSIFEVLEEG